MKIKDVILKVKRGAFTEPEDFTVSDFLCNDFFLSVGSFIDHNFTGAIKIDFPKKRDGYIKVSPYGFAYFLKMLLSEIYGNAMIKTNIEKDDEFIFITISGCELVKNREKLLDAAKRSGFIVCDSSEDTFLLKTKIYPESQFTAYAATSLVLINYLYESFLCE